MTTTEYVLDLVFPATFALLPEKMDTDAAHAMLLAIALQESGLRYRRQIAGPARGFLMFELGGGVQGVLQHPATRPIILPILKTLAYEPTASDCYAALSHHDPLLFVFGRLLLWSSPKALPAQGDDTGALTMYLDCWKPGKPRPKTWPGFFGQAWDAVKPA